MNAVKGFLMNKKGIFYITVLAIVSLLVMSLTSCNSTGDDSTVSSTSEEQQIQQEEADHEGTADAPAAEEGDTAEEVNVPDEDDTELPSEDDVTIELDETEGVGEL